MKNIKDKFETSNFVRPLYRHVTRKISPQVVDNNTKNLDGNENGVVNARQKSDVFSYKTRKNNINKERYQILLPGECTDGVNNKFTTRYYTVSHNNAKFVKSKMLEPNAKDTTELKNVNKSKDVSYHRIVPMVPDTWLRVYPHRIKHDESICSIIFRCLLCQLGIAVLLIAWTAAWVIVIHHFEEPFETKVSKDFQNEQCQIVIDLATELRQITPLSPKWRQAIEDRIAKERQLTIAAVGKGARLHPGHFWDLAGTFLFTVYVMTALGFGAPVPQTFWGRASSLIYAVVAAPTHIYLMVNLSTCVALRVENFSRAKCIFVERLSFEDGRNALDKDSPNCSRNSVPMKPNKNCLRSNIIVILRLVCVGRGVPLAALLYYVLGLSVFGLARSKPPLDVVMFPIEFTTTGGLEHVQSYVRVFYGLYVEGAMILLSCALATLKRQSNGPVSNVAKRYRLFTGEAWTNEPAKS